LKRQGRSSSTLVASHPPTKLSFVEEDGEFKVSRCQEFIDTQEYGIFTAKLA